MVVLDRITRAFDSVQAVCDLTLTVGDGEVFGLVGPNGAGKTTTLRMMTGLLAPDSGRVLIDGHDIATDPINAKMSFGYVPDKPFLYEKLTARELLVFTASIHGIGRQHAVPRIDELLVRFGISDVGDELIEGFSQGMRQRLIFAAALVHDPHVLFIDEPFVGLDPFGVRMLRELIQKLGESGKCIFLATHSLHIAEEVCHRVGFINRGRLITIKSRDEIAGIEGGLEELFLELGR